MRGGKRTGAGRKKKPAHLRRELLTVRLPAWMILQLGKKGPIAYIIEEQLAQRDFLDIPADYNINN